MPIHTCLIGPLCDEWPSEENPDDSREGCDHGSCLHIVNQNWMTCRGCCAEMQF